MPPLQTKWEMEVDEIEAVLEKIWDLHDKLSDAIHSISRAHFINSIKNPHRKSDEFCLNRKKKSSTGDDFHPDQKNGPGFVFVKDFRVDEDEPSIKEAKSLYAIRTALENLEDQLEFFHTVQMQQRAERDAALARLEQSRIILAMRLAEHQGKKYRVIEEAQALVGDVRDASRFVAPENHYNSTPRPSSESIVGKRPSALVNLLISSFNFVSKSLRLDCTAGIIGNAALLAISMLALVNMNQVGCKGKYTLDNPGMHNSSSRRVSRPLGPSSGDFSTHLDVTLARG